MFIWMLILDSQLSVETERVVNHQTTLSQRKGKMKKHGENLI